MLRKVVTENGILQGTACGDPRITVFKGVPYAAPPIGELRWRGPQPAANWEGVFRADHFAPMEVQSKIGVNEKDFYTKELHPTAAEYPMSEDCLYFNMWSPAKSEKDNLPIYVWFHGGGLQSGYSYEMEFDGERMAREGVIVVSVGYRLNVFSFLCHPELTAEDPQGCHGNYGLEDVVYCIKWLKRNGRAFGGDPERITVGGQSGSAFGAIVLASSPETEGLLQGIIMQSGGGLRALGYGNRCIPLGQAEHYGEEFLKELGVPSVAEARRKSAEEVYEAYRRMGGGFDRWSPCIDGKFLLEDPTDAMIRGHHHNIAYLYGSTMGEGGFLFGQGKVPETVEELKAAATAVFGKDTDSFIRFCNFKSREEIRKVFLGDTFNPRTIGARAFSITQAEQGRDGYCYIFNHDIPGDDAGAYHGSDLWFVFNTLDKCWRPFTGKHYDLARMAVKYWTNFIKTGDPNGFDQDGSPLPEWKSVSEERDFVMEFADVPRKEARGLDKAAVYRIDYQLKKNREKDTVE